MKNNSFGNALTLIGELAITLGIIGSFICGEFFPKYYTYSSGYIHEGYNWGLVIIGIIGSIIWGLSFMGLGEIINLLQKISDNQEQTQ